MDNIVNSMPARFTQLIHTTAEWEEKKNFVLLKGEIGIESTNNKMKVGDGITPWKDLSYFVIQNLEPDYNSWQDIKKIVQMGYANQVFNIGDQLFTYWESVTYKQDIRRSVLYEVPLDIVAFGDVYKENVEQAVPGMFLQWHYALPFAIQFDNIRTPGVQGSVQWNISGIRQFLNSNKLVDEWWPSDMGNANKPVIRESTNTTSENNIITADGFVSGFKDKNFLDAISPVQVTTRGENENSDNEFPTYITYDKFFIPSLQEVYGTDNYTTNEGITFPYWKEAVNTSEPCQVYKSSPAYQIYRIDNTNNAIYCALRTCRKYGYNNIYFLQKHEENNAKIASANPIDSFSCTPVCVVC